MRSLGWDRGSRPPFIDKSCSSVRSPTRGPQFPSDVRAEATLQIPRPGGYWAGRGRGGNTSLPGGVSRLPQPRSRPGRRCGSGAGGDRITPDEPGSGSGGECRLREEVTRRAWLWTWLESPGGIPGSRHPQGGPREEASIPGSRPLGGAHEGLWLERSSSIQGLLPSLWSPSLPL